MFDLTLYCSKARHLNKKPRQTTVRPYKQVLVFIALLTCLSMSVTLFAAPAFVLLTVDKDAQGLSSLPQQLANWKLLGRVSEAQILRSEADEESNFEMLGILEFSNEQALQRWKETEAKEMGGGVNVIVSDVLAHLETSPRNSTNSVFLIMQYDVMVPQTEFEAYIEGYQLPEMVVRIDAGGLIRYTSYFKRSESTASWQSLLVVEYRDEHAYEVSADVNSALGKLLAKTDKTFKMYKETKHGIRDKTLTTKASWVELPSPEIAK